MRAQRLLQHGLGALLHLDCLQGICFTYITSCTHTHTQVHNFMLHAGMDL